MSQSSRPENLSLAQPWLLPPPLVGAVPPPVAPVNHWTVGALPWEKSCIRPCIPGRLGDRSPANFSAFSTIFQSVAWFKRHTTLKSIPVGSGRSVGSLKLRKLSYSAKTRAAFGLARNYAHGRCMGRICGIGMVGVTRAAISVT